MHCDGLYCTRICALKSNDAYLWAISWLHNYKVSIPRNPVATSTESLLLDWSKLKSRSVGWQKYKNSFKVIINKIDKRLLEKKSSSKLVTKTTAFYSNLSVAVSRSLNVKLHSPFMTFIVTTKSALHVADAADFTRSNTWSVKWTKTFYLQILWLGRVQ